MAGAHADDASPERAAHGAGDGGTGDTGADATGASDRGTGTGDTGTRAAESAGFDAHSPDEPAAPGAPGAPDAPEPDSAPSEMLSPTAARTATRATITTRATRATPRADSARRSRARHGRGSRGSVTGPDLAPLRTRIEDFESGIVAAAEYLRELWPDELLDVTFEVAALPSGGHDGGDSAVARWTVFQAERRVILYRVPIERLFPSQRSDDLRRRMLVESMVFRAVAELLGKDPWELAPDRFRHL